MPAISTAVGHVAGTGSIGREFLGLVLRSSLPDLTSASDDEFSALTDVPVFLGYMLSYLLQGILIVQVFVYYLSFRRTDPLYMKITVFALFSTETLSVVVATVIVIMSIIKVGDLSYSIGTWPFKVVALLCGLCSSMVHAFYCWRIRILKGSWWPIAAIMTLSIIQFVMLGISAFGTFQGEYGDFLGAGTQSLSDTSLVAINVLWLGGSGTADIIIALTLLYLLNRVATQLPKESRDTTRLERVMGTAIDTGMITAMAASLELLFFLILPNSLVHFVIFYTLPKLYANCVMATLNARLTVPGKCFRESSADWESAISQHGIRQDDVFGLVPEKQSKPSALSIEFNQEVSRRSESNSRKSSILDIENNFYSEVVAKRSSIFSSKNVDFPLEYNATVEQAYRAQFVPATEISPQTSPRNNEMALPVPEADGESLAESESTTRRNTMMNSQEAGDVQESVNAPVSLALANPDPEVLFDSTAMAESDSDSQDLSLSSSSSVHEPQISTVDVLPASSRSSSSSSRTGTIRLLPKIPTTTPLQFEP